MGSRKTVYQMESIGCADDNCRTTLIWPYNWDGRWNVQCQSENLWQSCDDAVVSLTVNSDDDEEVQVCGAGVHKSRQIGKNQSVEVSIGSKNGNNVRCYFWSTESGNLPVEKVRYKH